MSNVIDYPRGAIRNDAQYTQRKSFESLRFGKITGTDIDVAYEFSKLVTMDVELKFCDDDIALTEKNMSYGQRTLYERRAVASSKGGLPYYVLLSPHQYPPEETIDVGNCKVNVVFDGTKNIWVPIKDKSVRQVFEFLLEKYNISY